MFDMMAHLSQDWQAEVLPIEVPVTIVFGSANEFS
jgi:hypothetical protein